MSGGSIVRFLCDERGQDLVEYAAITGAISVGGVVVWVLTLLLMRINYTNWQSGVQSAWEPGAPCGC